MCADLAILACGGALPVQILAAQPEARCYALMGIPHELGDRAEEHRIERLGGLFEAMRAAGVERVVLAGHLARPALDPTALDPLTMQLAPRIMAGLQKGDDGLLTEVIRVFEDQGFSVVGAHDLVPGLTAEPDLSVGPEPGPQDEKDITRAWEILSALGPLDVGQGCVVAAGQCLGIEAVQGTNALLRFVGETPERLKQGAKGVFVKTAKPGQDLRVDMPAIGPETIAAVEAAGLAGLVIEVGRVMILDRDATLAAVEKAGLFLVARIF